MQFNKSDMQDAGTFPVINGGINPSGYIEKYNQLENTITISQGGASAGYVNWITTKFWAGAHCYIVKPSDNVINRYIFHFLKSKEKNLQECQYGAGISALSKVSVENVLIPIPPLEVQREIVRILDKFTELTAELTEKLTAELTARKKQYEYYRDLLLTFDSHIEWKTLGEICELITKGTTPPYFSNYGINFIKTEAFEGSRINPDKITFISDEIHQGNLKRSKLAENDILITIAGATIGKCVIVPKNILPANTNQALAIIRLKNKKLVRYVFHVLKSSHMKLYCSSSIKGSAQPNLNLKQLNDFKIPVPPIEEQERIVKILDRFDKLCNDISEGLPAEISARKKQYEYYRDKLLTFKERE